MVQVGTRGDDHKDDELGGKGCHLAIVTRAPAVLYGCTTKLQVYTQIAYSPHGPVVTTGWRALVIGHDYRPIDGRGEGGIVEVVGSAYVQRPIQRPPAMFHVAGV